MLYRLIIDGVVAKESDKIKFLRGQFYLALSEGKKVWIERDGKKVWFNGKAKKDE